MSAAPRMLLLLLLLAGRLWGAACHDPGVRIVEERQGNAIRLFAESSNCLDLTITLTTELVNMRASASLPVTVESRGQSRVELIRLQAADPAQRWSYRYDYHWRYGGRGGQPDDTVYQLPFAVGAGRRLIQGYRGAYSHQSGSPNEHAHDWDLAIGSEVLAAREGLIVGIRQDSTVGGASDTFKNCANYVIIRHADLTYAEYVHLQPESVRVRLGDKVRAGQVLALSGNTGWSSGPHLHFAVFRTIDGQTRESLPVQFRVKAGTVQTLRQGRTY